MDHEITISADCPYALVKAEGVITPPDFTRQIRDLVSHPQWKPGMNILSDYLGADAHELTTEEIRAMAQGYSQSASLLGPGRSAIVVRESLQYGLTRMWISWTQSPVEREVRAFTSIDDARKWLLEGLDEPERERA